MRLRPLLATTAAVIAAAAVGIGGGYAAGRLDRPEPAPPPHPAELGSAVPVPADPELPVAKAIPYLPDTHYPTLRTDLHYVPRTARGAGHVWSYLVPAGWTGQPGDDIQDPQGTMRWRPADETPADRGFLLRIAPMSARVFPEDAVDTQKRKMMADYRDVRVLKETDDSVWFAYRTNDDYLRFNYFAWVRFPGTQLAGFELSVAGRTGDRDGLQALLQRVEASVKMRR